MRVGVGPVDPRIDCQPTLFVKLSHFKIQPKMTRKLFYEGRIFGGGCNGELL